MIDKRPNRCVGEVTFFRVLFLQRFEITFFDGMVKIHECWSTVCWSEPKHHRNEEINLEKNGERGKTC